MNNKKTWMILNSTILAAWVVGFFIVFPKLVSNSETNLTPFLLYNIILFLCTFITIIVCYFSKYKFLLYAILCMLWGFAVILFKNWLIGFITFSLSFIFLWRQHRLASIYARTLAFFTCLVPTGLTFIVARGAEEEIYALSQIAAFLLIIFLVLYLLYPLYNKKGIAPKKIISLKDNGLSERQIIIFTKVLAAEKYTVIAQELNCSLSTINKDIKDICDKLGVSDKTELLVRYSGCDIQG